MVASFFYQLNVICILLLWPWSVLSLACAMCVRPPHAPLATQSYRSRMFGWVCDCWLMIYTPCSSVRMFRSNIFLHSRGEDVPFPGNIQFRCLVYVLWTSRLTLVWELVKILRQFSSFDRASLYSHFSQYHFWCIYKHRQMRCFCL